ncbi:hypothetical protein TSMEX_001212 [Taenia solium]|eukprot:TsM_000176500 transcript=TsM_000176500 gene=TsM_000176500
MCSTGDWPWRFCRFLFKKPKILRALDLHNFDGLKSELRKKIGEVENANGFQLPSFSIKTSAGNLDDA